MTQTKPHGWAAFLGICLSVRTFGGSMTYTVRLNPEVCHEVQLGRFTLPKEAAFLDSGMAKVGVTAGHCRPAVRSASETGLYLGMMCLSPKEYPAPEKYAVDWSGRKGHRLASVRRISEDEWRSAVDVPWSAGSGIQPRKQDSGIRYNGPLLERSGPKWAGDDGPLPWAKLSYKGTRAAVNSWDGVDEVYSILDLDSVFKRNRIDGQYWIDLYETSSGQPLVRIQGSFHGAEPFQFQYTASWYSERYYVLPIGRTTWTGKFNLRRLLICDADAAARKSENVLKQRK